MRAHLPILIDRPIPSRRKPVVLSLIVVALTTSFSACDTRYHLAGNVPPGDGGQQGGQLGSTDAGVPTNPGSGGAGGVKASTGGASGSGAAGTMGGAGTGGILLPSTTPPAPVALAISPREAVTRVARVLWESVPDAALVAMADSGAIATDADLRGVARTMLGDQRARAAVGHFYRWWLDLDRLAFVLKDSALYPQYTAAVADAMAAETEAFGVGVTLDEDARFGTLLLASHSYLNQALAPLYGVSGITGSSLRRVDLDPTWRAGIFTQLSQQALTGNQVNTSPTHRGMMIRQKLLCEELAPPPPGVVTLLEPSGSGPKTVRQRITEETAAAASCGTCHSLMDPVGFAYEVFDTIGRVRLTDSGLPIDATGKLITTRGPVPTFDGPVELAQVLATLPEAQHCMGKQWLTYALGQPVDTAAEQASADYVYAHFVTNKLDLRSLIAAVVTSPAFLAPTGGTPCTPGLDQTCNDSPIVSAIYGTCTATGKCVCDSSSFRQLNPATGRCQ